MGKKEAHVEDYLVQRIEAIGGLIRKAVWVGRRGCPDRFAMVPPEYRLHILNLLVSEGRDDPDWRNPWVEAKSAEGELEDHQVREHARMRSYGEIVLVLNTRELVDRYFPLEL